MQDIWLEGPQASFDLLRPTNDEILEELNNSVGLSKLIS